MEWNGIGGAEHHFGPAHSLFVTFVGERENGMKIGCQEGGGGWGQNGLRTSEGGGAMIGSSSSAGYYIEEEE